MCDMWHQNKNETSKTKRRVENHLDALSEVSWQLVLPWCVGNSGFLSRQIVHPCLVGYNSTLVGPLVGEVEPREGIAHGANLVTDTDPCEVAHLVVEVLVRVQLDQVVSNCMPVACMDDESVLAMLNLQLDTTSVGSDDRLPLVDCLRDLHLETFSGG